MDISMTKFRNQEALNKALNIYKVSMCQFIFEHLQKRGFEVKL